MGGRCQDGTRVCATKERKVGMEKYHGILSDLSEMNDLMTGMFGRSKDYFFEKVVPVAKKISFSLEYLMIFRNFAI